LLISRYNEHPNPVDNASGLVHMTFRDGAKRRKLGPSRTAEEELRIGRDHETSKDIRPT